MDNKHDEDREGVFDSILYWLGSVVVSVLQFMVFIAMLFVTVVLFDEFKVEIMEGLGKAWAFTGDFFRGYFGSP